MENNPIPRVTILLPVRSGGPHLEQAVHSVLRQTFRDFRLMIIHDASDADIPGFIDAFRDKRIQLLSAPELQSLVKKLNHGLSRADSDYVARMDADDICLPERLAKQVAYMDAHPDVGICGTWARTFGSGESIDYKYHTDPEKIRAATLFDSPFAHPTVMFRRTLFAKFGLRYNEDCDFAEDYDLWARAVDCFPCVNVPEILLEYRLHDSSMTAADWSKMNAQCEGIVMELLKKLGLEPAPEDLTLHRRIGRGCSYQCASIEELEKAEAWLTKLCAANERENRYDREFLRQQAAVQWHRLCLTSSHLGFAVAGVYRRSAMGTWRKALKLFLSVWMAGKDDSWLDPRSKS